MNPLQARYPEAFEYLRARGVEPSADFYERVETARKQAWTMSKLSDLDHIQRIKDSLEKAIAEGTSFDNWRKENLADLQDLPKSYQETVFRTAVQSSYNAGRWAHFRDHAERRPILRYTAINDSRTRPAHRALHGLMMPVDDPRWQTLAPPGGFNCRCTLMSLSERQAKGMGYTGAPQDIPTWTDKHGVEHTAAPDKGWNHSPEHDLTDLLREREKKAGVAPAQYSEPEAIKQTLPPPEQWREVAKAGEEIWAKHTDLLNAVDHTKAGDFSRAILGIMEREGVQTGAEVKANGDTVANFQKIINRYPASWVERANEAGTVYIRNLASRGFQTYLDEEMAGYVNKLGKFDADFKPFTKLAEQFQVGDSLLKLNNMAGKELSEKAQDIAIHEFGHRLQYTIPGLDDYFKQLWLDRTAGEKTRPLRDIQKERGEEPYFHRDEKGRKDAFADVYIGKNYGTDDEPQPFEVLAMVFQTLLGSGKSRGLTPQGLLERDPEMLYLGLGLLTRFTP